jgi:hypothetical protein
VIVSHEHRFVFVRTRKTAGTSIEIALSALLGPDAIITSQSPRDEALRREHGGRPPQNHLADGHRPDPDRPVLPGPGPHVRFYNHMPAEAVRAELGERVWNSYFTFCFERNPWDKVVSLYFHRYREEPRPGIEAFVRSGEGEQALNWPLYTLDGRPAVDFVGRFERLAEDTAEVFERIGLPAPRRLPRAKTQFRPPRTSYRSVLDPATRQLVARGYAPEIAHHGYTW